MPTYLVVNLLYMSLTGQIGVSLRENLFPCSHFSSSSIFGAAIFSGKISSVFKRLMSSFSSSLLERLELKHVKLILTVNCCEFCLLVLLARMVAGGHQPLLLSLCSWTWFFFCLSLRLSVSRLCFPSSTKIFTWRHFCPLHVTYLEIDNICRNITPGPSGSWG